MLKIHFSHVPTSLTVPEYEQRTLYSAFVVTLAMLLRLLNCRFIITIYCYYYYYYTKVYEVTLYGGNK